MSLLLLSVLCNGYRVIGSSEPVVNEFMIDRAGDSSRSSKGSHSNRQLNEALRQWRCWGHKAPSVVRQLTGGLTNETYLLKSANQLLVLRLNTENSQDLDLDRKIEAIILQSASRISSALVYADPDERYLVTQYIEGKQWSLKDSHSVVGIMQLAKILTAIHGLASVDRLMNANEKASVYWRSIDQQSLMADQLRSLEPEIQCHVEWAAEKNKTPCLCHNDLVRENLIQGVDQALYAIDWEYAAMGDPYFDLAVVVESHGMDSLHINQLLRAYNNDSIVPENRRRLWHNRIIYCYLELLWYGVQYTGQSSEAVEDFFSNKVLHLKSLLIMDE